MKKFFVVRFMILFVEVMESFMLMDVISIKQESSGIKI
jgi:hypothetical protein